MKTRFVLTAVAAGIACAPAFAAPPAADAGAWTKVPPLTTACYSEQDPWVGKNDAAIEAMRETLDAQKETNRVLDEQLTNALSSDPMAMAQAMQQAMLEDPANAQKMIEKMTQTGQQAQTELPAQMEKEKQIDAEAKAVAGRYKAALTQAEKPAQARWNAFQKKVGWAVEPGFAMMPDPSWPPAAWQEWAAVQKDRDAAYAATCAQWWSATGEFQAYMKRYKAFLVQERMPYEKKLIDDPKLDQYKLLNVPSEGYRTTTDYDAAIDYMKMASEVYGQRDSQPLCRPGNACQ